MKPFPLHQATAYSVKNMLPLGRGASLKTWNRWNSWYDENGSLYCALQKGISSLIRLALQHENFRTNAADADRKVIRQVPSLEIRIQSRQYCLANRYLHIFCASASWTASGDFSFRSTKCMQIKLWHKQTREDERCSSEKPPLHQQTSEPQASAVKTNPH